MSRLKPRKVEMALVNLEIHFEKQDVHFLRGVPIVYSRTDPFSYLRGATDQEAAKLDFSLFSQTVSQSIAGSPGNGPNYTKVCDN